MSHRVLINGFGRIGKLATRLAWYDHKKDFSSETPTGIWGQELEIVGINDPKGNIQVAQHLLEFDSTHGRFPIKIYEDGKHLFLGNKKVKYSNFNNLEEAITFHNNIDIILECSGKFKNVSSLSNFFEKKIRKIIFSYPIKNEYVKNIVMGVNHLEYNKKIHHFVTGASCTTNCLAPIVKVMKENYTIKHGLITTIHDITNSQSIIDGMHSDIRRSRSSSTNLIPTTTGSAKAIGLIFPELEGKLDGLAVRVPVLNASLTDCVFEIAEETSIEEINSKFKEAANSYLKGILGYEERLLVSSDYVSDTRSSIIDAQLTMVNDKNQVKIISWYDNEYAYSLRLLELCQHIIKQDFL